MKRAQNEPAAIAAMPPATLLATAPPVEAATEVCWLKPETELAALEATLLGAVLELAAGAAELEAETTTVLKVLETGPKEVCEVMTDGWDVTTEGMPVTTPYEFVIERYDVNGLVYGPVADEMGATGVETVGRADEATTGADEATTGADDAATGADEWTTGADDATTGADDATTGAL